MTPRLCSVVVLLALAAIQTASGQSLDRKVVIVGTPGKDAAVWKKIAPPAKPFSNVEELRKAFDESEYLFLEDDEGWVFIFDRDHPTLRRQRSKEPVFNAFLRLSDENGALMFGDLSASEKEVVLELFSSSAWALRAMGDAVNDVKIALRTTITLEAEVDGRTVLTRTYPSRDVERLRLLTKDMTEHGVPANMVSTEETHQLFMAGVQDAQQRNGLTFRYIGVHKRAQGQAIRAALDAFDRYLREDELKLEQMYSDLENRFISEHIPEFGGRLPNGSLSREQVPERFWFSFTGAVRSNADYYGLKSELEVERFLAGAKTVKFRTSYSMFYIEKPAPSITGRATNAVGHSVEIVRH